MKRRDFLRFGSAGLTVGALGASGLMTWTPRAHAALIARTYYITDGTLPQPDGTAVYFRGYASEPDRLEVPGASFIVQEGDTVQIRVVNTLGSPHGFTIDGLTDTGPIPGGHEETVEFPAEQPGSYLFYDGVNEPYGRLLGLHGAMAIMPAGSADQLYPGSPSFAQQKFWVFNDIDPVWHARLRDGLNPDTAFKPRYFTINGRSMRPRGAPGYHDPDVDAGADLDTALHGHVGDRTLIRLFNAGLCEHSVHWHANHVEWLTRNGVMRPDIWRKDVLRLPNDKGRLDVIFPFEAPPDAWPRVMHGEYPVHLHDEMTQTAGGGLYQFGAATHIAFEH